jgi:hypothetical protein
MTAADASLIVGVGLVFGAAVCRLTVWAQSAGEHGTAVARTYQAPAADWGLVALAGHALALILAADAGAVAWAATAVLACVALALRAPAPAAIHAPEEPPAAQPEPAPIAARGTRGSLWAQTGHVGSRLPPER